MTHTASIVRGSLLGFEARKLRVSLRLTRRQLADLAGVSLEAVNTFEHNLPLLLDIKRRILRELWAKKQRSDVHHVTPCLV
jgi:DNA-binding XRE family transcriptional regulator